jgi:ceramide glucosyltransferase
MLMKLITGYAAAKYELLLVSDSGIRMREDTLKDMVSCMGERVGLVHQMPFTCDRSGIPATLEKVYFGTSHARIYLSTNLLGINCATGMSALMKKEVLDSVGGLKAFGKYLAEDYFMAKTFQEKGYSIVISSQPAWQNAGDISVVVFQNRLTRWTKLRSAMCPHTIFLEPLSECMLLGCLSAWAVFFLFRWDPISFFLIHVLIWFIMDWALLHIVQNGSLPFNKFEFLVMWLYREVSAPYLFVVAQINPAIQWRSKDFRLRWGGLVEAIEHKSSAVIKL